jgi:hypothetical protein
MQNHELLPRLGARILTGDERWPNQPSAQSGRPSHPSFRSAKSPLRTRDSSWRIRRGLPSGQMGVPEPEIFGHRDDVWWLREPTIPEIDSILLCFQPCFPFGPSPQCRRGNIVVLGAGWRSYRLDRKVNTDAVRDLARSISNRSATRSVIAARTRTRQIPTPRRWAGSRAGRP